MAFLKGLLWFLCILAVIAIAMYMTNNFAMAERLAELFLEVQPLLPVTLDFSQFLVLVTVISVLIVALVIAGSTAILLFAVARLAFRRQQQMAQVAAAAREINHIKDQHQQQYGELCEHGGVLTKRLDKRMIVQAIVRATSRVTSVQQTDSAVCLWLLDFETDTLGFEIGLYCDASLFNKTRFELTEAPFAHVIKNQKPSTYEAWNKVLTCVRQEKSDRLASASALMLVPLVIESSVLGVLMIFCHPDVIRSYNEKGGFYDAMWTELALGLAIAIQGELAILDRLTGVHHREYFMKRLIQELDRANRFQVPVALLMIDIDDFKAVNDTLGHPQGDAVLKIIARIIKKEVRAIDLVGRYGGEEFIIMLPETGFGDDSSSAVGALALAERIRKAIDDEFRGMQKPLDLTVSIGVAVRRFPEDRQTDHRDLIRVSDEQLYRAKTTGKNKVCALIPETPQEVK